MKDYIILDKEKGVNPRLTLKFCPICMKDKVASELLLLGNQNYRAECRHCGTINICSKTTFRCQNCGEVKLGEKIELKDNEKVKLSGLQICNDCLEELEKKTGEKRNDMFFVIESSEIDGGMSFSGSYLGLRNGSPIVEHIRKVSGAKENFVLAAPEDFRQIKELMGGENGKKD